MDTLGSDNGGAVLLGKNQYFTAGLGIFGVGTGLALLRQSLVKGFRFLSNHYVSSIEVTSKDPGTDGFWIGLERIASCHQKLHS